MYNTELDLANDGFVLTPNVWLTPAGAGKVFEKIVNDVRVYYGVAPDGSVSSLEFQAGQAQPAAPVEPAPAPEVPATPAEAAADAASEVPVDPLKADPAADPAPVDAAPVQDNGQENPAS